MGEYRQAVAFQEAVWGAGFSERVPASLMTVTRRLGGVVAGAFQEEELVGFVYGMTGVEEGRLIHWSDILAVKTGLRDGGLGRRLKLFQREEVLARSVTLMRWTFDPLESRNAWLNLGRLGAVLREYVPDMYGESTSPLHRGLGTDRFVVSWELDSERVERRTGGGSLPPAGAFSHLPPAFPVVDDGVAPRPGTVPPDVLEQGSRHQGLRVPIPADIQGLRDRDPALAAAWRRATREVLAPALARGWEVRELVREGGSSATVSHYVMVPPGAPSNF